MHTMQAVLDRVDRRMVVYVVVGPRDGSLHAFANLWSRVAIYSFSSGLDRARASLIHCQQSVFLEFSAELVKHLRLHA